MSKYLPPRRELIGMIIGAIVALIFIGLLTHADGESPAPTASAIVQESNREHILLNTYFLFGITAFFGVLTTAFWRKMNRAVAEKEAIAKGHQAVLDEQVAMRLQLATITAAAKPIEALYQALLIKELTHFHTPETDLLLAKLAAGTLTEEEDARLFDVLMPEREKDMGDLMTESERDAAHILRAVSKRKVAEAQKIAANKNESNLVTAVISIPVTA